MFNYNNFFGMMRFGYNMTSHSIDEKLNKEDCTLEGLLDEDEIIQEMKYQNQKLIDFFTKQKVKGLLNYIIKEPLEDDHRTGHKFPFNASELLACDVPKILDYFCTYEPTNGEKPKEKKNERYDEEEFVEVKEGDKADDAFEDINSFGDNNLKKSQSGSEAVETKENDKLSSPKKLLDVQRYESQSSLIENIPKPPRVEILDYFFTFLETDNELNYVLAGYFASFFNNLLRHNSEFIVNYLFTARLDILDRILSHANRRSIIELLPKILTFERSNCEKKDLEFIRRELIGILLSKVESDNFEELNNSVVVIHEILENKECLEIIVNTPKIQESLFNAISNPKSNQNATDALDILHSLVKLACIEGFKMPSPILTDDVNTNETQEFNNTPLGDMILTNLPSILEAFKPDERQATFLGTYGEIVEPLGFKRVKIIELIQSLTTYFKQVKGVLDGPLIRADFFSLIWKYLFKYEWNNMYQYHFEHLMKILLENHSHYNECIVHMFKDINIVKEILTKNTDNLFSYSSGRTVARGYCATLVETCTRINQCKSTVVIESFTNIWHQFMKEKINTLRKLYNTELCKTHDSPIYPDEPEPSPNEPEIDRNNEVSSGDDWLNSDIDFEKKIEYVGKDNDIKMDEFIFVDEIQMQDSEKFNDTHYWRRKSIDDDTLQNALKDLDL